MTRVEGLTLRNGNGNPGGAVHIGSSVAGTGPGFANCRFIANRTPSQRGGAIFNEGDALVQFTRCHFEDNSAGFDGGAIGDYGGFIHSDVTLVDCTLIRNTAVYYGGAISEHSFGALNLSGCVFADNGAQRGGALFLSNPIARPGPSGSRLGRSPSDPDGALNEYGLVTECTFVSNEAQEGGAVVLFSFAPEFQRCLFTDNVATQGGAVSGTNGILIGCTLVGNRGDSGAAVCDDPFLPWFEHVLINCIVAFSGPDQAIRRVDPEGCTYLECCDLFGNEGGDWVGCIAGLLGTDGNISEDPAFCDAQGGDFIYSSRGIALRT